MIGRRAESIGEPARVLRLESPLVRGVLLDLWRERRASGFAPLAAWESLRDDERARRRWVRSRGKGGFARVKRPEALELLAAAIASEVRASDGASLVGLAPSPSAAPLLAAAGLRLVELLGGQGVEELEPGRLAARAAGLDVKASVEQAAEVVVLGPAPLQLPRTAVSLARARLNGARVRYLSPLFDALAPFGDEWLPVAPGTLAAFWDAVAHVVLSEAHAQGAAPALAARLLRETNVASLVRLEPAGGGYRPGEFLPAARLDGARPDDSSPLSLVRRAERRELLVPDGAGGTHAREIPIGFVASPEGHVPVATVYDLLFALRGVSRGLPGDWPAGYEDDQHPATPAWQALRTGIAPASLIEFARDLLHSASASEGHCVLVVPPGATSATALRAAAEALFLCGATPEAGGGLHFLSEEPLPRFEHFAFARDWLDAPRLGDRSSWEAHQLAADRATAATMPRVALSWGEGPLASCRELFMRDLLGTSDLALPEEELEVPRGHLDLFAAFTGRLYSDSSLADLVLPVGPGAPGPWETTAELARCVDLFLEEPSRVARRFATTGPRLGLSPSPIKDAEEAARCLNEALPVAPPPTFRFDVERRAISEMPLVIAEGMLVQLIERGPQQDGSALLALGRGCRTVWLEPEVALQLGVAGGDWVELANEWGALCASAAISPGVPAGCCVVDTVAELPLDLPRSPALDGRRSGTVRNLRGPAGDDLPMWATIRRLEQVRF